MQRPGTAKISGSSNIKFIFMIPKIIKTGNNRQVLMRRFDNSDFENLFLYLQNLGPETLKRFGPHPFDKQSIIDFYKSNEQHYAYLALDVENQEIIAYFIIKSGYLRHDSFRLQSYGLNPDAITDCTFAPSVADSWQSSGIGSALFGLMLPDLKSLGFKRIILWGGVQADNLKAVNFYRKHGFIETGEFEYNGLNYDMILII
jgi:diamine N-acetyltransferase